MESAQAGDCNQVEHLHQEYSGYLGLAMVSTALLVAREYGVVQRAVLE
jgi:hypothetical protein